MALKTIKIFIASSAELKADREEIRVFIGLENDRLHKQGIYLKLIQWEYFLDAISDIGLQNEYNKAISECDIVLCLFFTKVGKFTNQEFNTAYKVFKDTGKPKIWTYFKDAPYDIGSLTKEILTLFDFKEKLAELKHFHSSYKNIDDFKNQFRMQLDNVLPEIAGLSNTQPSDSIPDHKKLQRTRKVYMAWLRDLHQEIKVKIPSENVSLYLPNDQILVQLREDLSADDRLNQAGINMRGMGFQTMEEEVDISQNYDNRGFKNAWGNRAFTSGEIRSLEYLVENHRLLVLLGDPGSGKTTLIKYIASRLAQTEEKTSFKPGTFFDNYFPIVVCIADYAEAYLEHNRKLPLETYLRSLTWKKRNIVDRRGKAVPEGQLSALFAQELDKQNAFIILDGLDEVSQYRDAIMNEIERFIDDRIPAFVTNETNPQSRNLLVATSRIIGYEARPLQTKGVVRAKVDSMSRAEVVLFVERIFKAFKKPTTQLSAEERQFLIKENSTKIPGKLSPLFETISDLISKIYEEKSVIQELAGNPMLLTVICGVYFTDQQLSQVKADLYHRFVMGFAELPRIKVLSADQLKELLTEVAFHIHQHKSNEIIGEKDLRHVLEKVTKKANFPNEVDNLLHIFAEDSGLLIPRAKGVFSFLHRTFQEYLAACYLVSKEELVITNLQTYLYSPYWREVLVFSLSEISRTYSSLQFEEVSIKLVENEQQNATIIPHLAWVFAHSIAFLNASCVTPNLIIKLVERMIFSYSVNYFKPYQEVLQSHIASSLVRLAKLYKVVIIQALNELMVKEGHTSDIFWGTIEIVRATGLFNQVTLRILAKYEFYDRAEWDFPISRFFDGVVAKKYQIEQSTIISPPRWDEKEERQKSPGEYQKRYRFFQLNKEYHEMQVQRKEILNPVKFPGEISRIRSFLIEQNGLLKSLRQKPALLRLTSIIYGGYGNLGVAGWHQYYNKLANFLQLPDSIRNMMMETNREFFAQRFGHDDTVYSCAVYLDTYKPDIMKQPADKRMPMLKPEFIYRDSTLHEFITRKLLLREDIPQLIKLLKLRYEEVTIVEEKIEVLLGLLALGYDIKPYLDFFQRTEPGYAAAISRIKAIPNTFADALFRSRIQLAKEIPIKRQGRSATANMLNINHFIETLVKAGGMTIEDVAAPAELEFIYKADNWFKIIVGKPDAFADIFNADTVPKGEQLKKTLVSVYWAPHVRSARHFTTFRWDTLPIPPSAREEVWPFEVYEIIESFTGFENLNDNRISLQSGFIDMVLRNASEILEEGHLLESELFARRVSHYRMIEYILLDGTWISMPSLKQLISKLSDPYLKARCLYQSTLAMQPLNRQQGISEILELVPLLTKPQQARLLSKIADLTIDQTQREPLLDLLIKAIKNIDEPAEQAILSVRALVSYVDPEQILELLKMALQALHDVDAESFDYLATLESVYPYLERFPKLVVEYQAAIDKCPDNWILACLEKRAGRHLIHEYDQQKVSSAEDNQLWTPFLLTSAAYDLLELTNESDSIENLWMQLAQAKTTGNLRTLDKILEQGQNQGITLNRSVAISVQEWVQTASETDQALLLPLLINPSSGALPLVETWYVQKQGILQKVSLLCLVEKNGQITTDNIDELIMLLNDDNERILLRAQLFFTGGIDKVTFEGGRKFKASLLGQAVLERTALEAILTEAPVINRTLRLFFWQTLHDTPGFLEDWLTRAAQENDQVASTLLKEVCEVTEECWEILKAGYIKNSNEIKELLMESLSWLSWRSNKQKFQPNDIQELLYKGGLTDLPKKYFCERHELAFTINTLSKEQTTWAEVDWAYTFDRHLVTVKELLLKQTFELIASSACHYDWSYIAGEDNKSVLLSLYSPVFYEGLLYASAYYLGEDTQKDITSALLDLLAFYTPHNPDRFERFCNENTNFTTNLFQCINGETFPNRVSCRAVLVLFRYLPSLNDEAVRLIGLSLNLIDDTLSGILEETIQQLDSRNIDLKIFDELINELNSPYSKRVQISANLLALLVRKNEFKGELMNMLIQKLNDLVIDPYSKRGIYQLLGTGNDRFPKTITFSKQLNEVIYESLLDVCGD